MSAEGEAAHSDEGGENYYYLPSFCDWGGQPSQVEGEWVQVGFLDPYRTVSYTTMSESDLTTEKTHTVGETTTQSIEKGFGVNIKGISASKKAESSISEQWSDTYRTEFTTKSSESTTVTVTSDDAQKAIDDGNPFLWTWQFTTTYNWNSIAVVTKTNTRAYTKNVGEPPKCVPNYGEDDTYQSCVAGGWLPGFEISSDNATVV